MKTSEIQIEKLKLATYNPRKISDKDLVSLKKSLKKFGFIQPVIVNKDMTVIGGHQRIRAWKEMGNETVPVFEVSISKKEEKALNLALNRISGDWDMEKLFNVISELRTEEELEFTGFDDKEVSQILDSQLEEEETLEEEIENAPAVAKFGNMYQLGEHRLLCGDSASEEDVKRLLGKNEMDMCFTDPPYNVNYSSSNKKLGNIKNDNMKADQFEKFISKVFSNIFENIKIGASAYICSGWQSFSAFEKSLKENGLTLSEVIIWVKNRAGIHTLDFPHKHEQIMKAKKVQTSKKKKAEAIFYTYKKKRNYYGDHSDYDVWEVDRLENGQYVHPTEKPDWLVMKALKNSTKFKDKVMDLFGGSGSTLMACEKMGRQAFILELDPRFVDVMIYRYEKLTKKKARKI